MKWFIHEGHGGKDVGAVGATGLYEKDVTLKVAKKLAKILEAHRQEVILARGKDVDLKSYDAANTANRLSIDYVVSIHCNSAPNSNATGTETFAYSTTSKGKPLAQLVQKNLVNEIKLPNRGVKYNSNFAILAKPTAPAILVEIGFINNPREEALLRDDKFLDKVAIGIAKGLLEHIGVKYNAIASIPTPKPANSGLQDIKVNIRGKNMILKGIFKDGTNYVAIRDIAEILGLTVEWNELTQTAVIR